MHTHCLFCIDTTAYEEGTYHQLFFVKMKNQEFRPKDNNNLKKPPVPYKSESVIRHARLSANSSIYSKNNHNNNNKNLIQKRICQFDQTTTTQVGFLLYISTIQYTNMHVLDYTKKIFVFL